MPELDCLLLPATYCCCFLLLLQGRKRFSDTLKTVPLYVVNNTRVGIIGSREYALRLAA